MVNARNSFSLHSGWCCPLRLLSNQSTDHPIYETSGEQVRGRHAETFSDKNMSTRVHFFICSSKSSSFFHSPMLQRRREPGVFNVDGHTQAMWGAVADPSPANTPLEAINMDIKTLQRSHWRKWHETHINVALNTDQEEGEGRGGQNIKGRSRKINEPEVKENSQK